MTGILHVDEELDELLADFFGSEVTPELVDEIERTGTWPGSLWTRASRTQIPLIGIDDERGGVGGSLADVAAAVRHAAFHAAPRPLIENQLGLHLMTSAGLDPVDGPVVVAGLGPDAVPSVIDGRMTGDLGPVAWAADAAVVAVLTRDASGRDVVALVDPSGAELIASRDITDLPSPRVRLDRTPVEVAVLDADVVQDVRRRAEVLRCAAMSGLLDRLYRITSEYVATRHQFGKPIGAFQSVQIHVVTLAQAAAMSAVCVDRAVSAVAAGDGDLESAATAAVIDEYAALAVAAAHQAHGAIGMTREYPLQQVTRRIQALRQGCTPTIEVAERLGTIARQAPSFSRLVARHPEEENTTA